MFIENLKLIHKDKYDYSETVYTTARNLITVNCPKHGYFNLTANSHQKGYGCSKCYGNYSFTTEEYIDIVSKVHNNKYDYSESNYINMKSEITIICPKHGKYEQQAECHKNGQECPKCGRNFYSKGQIEWLNLIEKLEGIQIQHMGNSFKEFKIPSTSYI